MIRTVTFNTGFDDIYVVSNVKFGGVSDLIERHTQPSGKGINLARTVRWLNHDVVAYGLIGRLQEREFRDALVSEGIATRLVAVDQMTRHNVSILSQNVEQSIAHFRAPGYQLESANEVDTLRSLLAADLQPGDVICLNGSLPAGIDISTWGRLASLAASHGCRTVVDIYGASLPATLAAAAVDVCKPNEHEIRSLPGVDRADGSASAVLTALYAMARHGVGLPMVSLGREGAAFLAQGRAHRARCTVHPAQMTVGAGDAMSAGIAVALALGETRPHDIVRLAVATATAHVAGTPPDRFRTDVATRGTDVSFSCF